MSTHLIYSPIDSLASSQSCHRFTPTHYIDEEITLEAIIIVLVFCQRRKELRVTNWLINGISELNRTVSKKGHYYQHTHHTLSIACHGRNAFPTT